MRVFLFCQTAAKEAIVHLDKMTHPVDIKNKEGLLKAAATSLNSKVVSKDSNLASLAVDAVMAVAEGASENEKGLDLKGTESAYLADDAICFDSFLDQKMSNKVMEKVSP